MPALRPAGLAAAAFVATLISGQRDASAECGPSVPPWLARQSDRVFFVGQATAATEEEARALARVDISSQIGRCGELRVSTTTNSREVVIFRDGSSGQAEAVSKEHVEATDSEARGSAAGAREVGAFTCEDKGAMTLRLVMSFPRHRVPEGCGGTMASPVGFAWRSALLPSWGQFDKGDRATGYVILGTELIAIPTAIITAVLSHEQRDRAALSHVSSERETYNARADNLFYVSAGATALAVGVYVFNVLNAYGASPDHGFGESRSTGSLPTIRIGLGPSGITGGITW